MNCSTAKTEYNEILANVDYLHGIAESFLTITNLLIVAAFRKAIMTREQAVDDSGKIGSTKPSFWALLHAFVNLNSLKMKPRYLA